MLLGGALAHNHTLEWLDVSYNALGEEGAQAIGTALLVRLSSCHLRRHCFSVTLFFAVVFSCETEAKFCLQLRRSM